MTANKKAVELLAKFKPLVWGNTAYTRNRRAQQAAVICVQEIINTHKHSEVIGIGGYNSDRVMIYWQQVLEYLNTNQ